MVLEVSKSKIKALAHSMCGEGSLAGSEIVICSYPHVVESRREASSFVSFYKGINPKDEGSTFMTVTKSSSPHRIGG